jgi:hypothetical protein
MFAEITGKLHEACPYLGRRAFTAGRTRNSVWAPITPEPRCWNTARILEKQQKMNYQNEYDRLRNALQETVLRRSVAGGMVRGPRIIGENKENVERRIAELEAQGAKK